MPFIVQILLKRLFYASSAKKQVIGRVNVIHHQCETYHKKKLKIFVQKKIIKISSSKNFKENYLIEKKIKTKKTQEKKLEKKFIEKKNFFFCFF